jgi:hypothetical protein
MAHEVVLLGSWGFVYCVVHCCKVYALAHHLGIPIKRPKPNLPVYPRPMYVPAIELLPHIRRSSLPPLVSLCLSIEPDQTLRADFISYPEQLRNVQVQRTVWFRAVQ